MRTRTLLAVPHLSLELPNDTGVQRRERERECSDLRVRPTATPGWTATRIATSVSTGGEHHDYQHETEPKQKEKT